MLKVNKIYNQDCIEGMKLLDDNSIDLIVTDPPYNSKSIDWDKKDNNWQISWLKEAYRVLKDGGSFYCFFAPMNMYVVEGWIRQNMTLKNMIVWHHPNLYGAGLLFGKDRYKSTWDVVFYAVKGKKAKHGKNVGSTAYRETGRGFDTMIYSQSRPLLHKAQKPLDLVKKFIICSSKEHDLILDPFVGVGTTAIACKELNRKYIGIDDVKTNCRISDIRLKFIYKLKRTDKLIWKVKKGKINFRRKDES